MWKIFLRLFCLYLIVVSNFNIYAKNITNDYLYFCSDVKKTKRPVENVVIPNGNGSDASNGESINDSLNHQETVYSDSCKYELFTTNKKIGSLSPNDVYKSIAISDFINVNYYTYNEILINKINCYPLFTGVPGNANAVSFLGAMPASNKLTLANAPINDLFYSTPNFNEFSPEFVRNIECYIGSEAVIYGGSSGLYINLQPTIFNTAKPYTRIWYNQGDHKHIALDGIFSQNFMPNWNFTAGFKTMFSDGSYKNSNIKLWNGRFALRHDISNNSNIALIYNFTNYYSGDFGGILFEELNKDENTANLVNVNFGNLGNRQYRNDVFIAYCYSSDSTIDIKSNLFFTNEENNIFWRNDAKFLSIDTNGANTVNSQITGITNKLSYRLSDNLHLNSGVDFGYDHLGKNILINDDYSGIFYNAYALLKYRIGTVNLEAGSRFENKYSEKLLSVSGKILFDLNDNNKLFFDLSFVNNTPLPVFNYEHEKHLLGLIGWKRDNNDLLLDFNLFYRRIYNPLLLSFDTDNIYSFDCKKMDISEKDIYGFAGLITTAIAKNLNLNGQVQTYINNNSPSCYLMVSCDYTYKKKLNFVKGGIGTAVQINNELLYYNPIFKMYAVSDLKSKFSFNGLNAYISAKLGNAFIRASLNNILGTDYSYIAYYPLQARELCLSLTWTLL